MGLFTSNGTGGGDFNNAATWTAGSGYPGSAETNDVDYFTIVAGDTVTYNVSSAIRLGGGDMTINGLLTFSPTANTKMVITGGLRIVVNDGGELRIGNSVTPIGSPYAAELYWYCPLAYYYDSLYIANGGKVYMYGDPSYYGSIDQTTLADDAENSDGDAVIKTTDDMSSLWKVGDRLYIHTQNDYGSYSDIKIYTISSFDGSDGTLITLNSTINADASWQGIIINSSRNIIIGKLTPSSAMSNYNMNSPGIYDQYDNTEGNVEYSNVAFHGVYSNFRDEMSSGRMFTNVVFMHCEIGPGRHTNSSFTNCRWLVVDYGVYECTDLTLTDCYFAASNYGVYNSKGCIADGCTFRAVNNVSSDSLVDARNNSFIDCDLGLNGTVLYLCTGYLLENCAINNCNAVFYGGSFHKLTECNIYNNGYSLDSLSSKGFVFTNCNIYSNGTSGISGSDHTFKNCKFGYTAGDVSSPNANDFVFNGSNDHYLLNCKIPEAGFIISGRNSPPRIGRIRCDHHDQVLNAYQIIYAFGDIVKTACDGTGDAPSEDPDGGNDYCIEASNIQSNLSADYPLVLFDYDNYKVWCAADVAKTFTFKVQTTYSDGGGIAAGGLVLQAEYLDGVNGGSVSIETENSTAIATRLSDADWTQTISVTVTPAEEGFVRLKLSLTEFETGQEVYVWPKGVIS